MEYDKHNIKYTNLVLFKPKRHSECFIPLGAQDNNKLRLLSTQRELFIIYF